MSRDSLRAWRVTPTTAFDARAGVDTRALARAFNPLSRQNVSFDGCDIRVVGTHATAQCDGAIEYVRRVGDAEPQSQGISWSFVLDHLSGQWRIANVTAR